MPALKTETDDERYPLLDAAIKKHRRRPDALIEILHAAQEIHGCVEPAILRHVAASLRLPPSKVYGVATFYHLFSLRPQGRHTCTICTGTACYVKGAATLTATVERMIGVKPGRTTADGQLTYRTARCFGACGLAPAAIHDGVVAGFQTPESTREFISRCLDEPG